MTMLIENNKVHLRERFSILVVDDNEIDRTTICHMLSLGKDAEYTAIIATSFGEAEVILNNKDIPIDLALLDYQLIDKTAEDVLQTMKQCDRDIPVIVATSFATKRKENQLLKYGIYDFWDKNLLNPASLEHSVRFALNRHQLSKSRYHSGLLQGDTLACVIHDLKNPISTIQSYNKISKRLGQNAAAAQPSENNSDFEKLEVCFDTIDKNCQLLQHLIEEILELSKNQSEQLTFPRQTIHVIKILRSCLLNFAPQISDNHLSLNEKLPSQDYLVVGNKDKLMQAFNNIISNAIKYTDKGSIDIRCNETIRDNTKFLQISISDTGIGINESDLERIFKPFNHVEHKTLKKVDSHGLGLSIVKSIIERHDGRILVESQAGKGSTFTIELPIAQN